MLSTDRLPVSDFLDSLDEGDPRVDILQRITSMVPDVFRRGAGILGVHEIISGIQDITRQSLEDGRLVFDTVEKVLEHIQFMVHSPRCACVSEELIDSFP